jgi:DNA-binding IclR family transcriptional regulator
MVYVRFYAVISSSGKVMSMVRPGPVGTIGDDLGHGSAVPSQRATGSDGEPAGRAAGRGVLGGAFAVLEALAPADGGLGLTALARATGLAKTSAYRLAEQLVSLGAVQRVDHRYYIGARIGQIGRQWQPDPLLRRAAQAPVHTLAVRAGAVASLRILHEDLLRVICATVPRGQACIPHPADSESTARTATGRVLYAAGSLGNDALPGCWTAYEWRSLRKSIHDLRATVVDTQEVFPGVCCVSAPVWWPDRRCAGAVTTVLQAAKPTPGLRELVVSAARCIGEGLR